LRLNLIDLSESNGEGFDTKLVQVQYPDGETGWAIQQVPWSYDGKDSGALYSFNLNLSLCIQTSYRIHGPYFAKGGITGLLGVTPMVNDDPFIERVSRSGLYSVGLLYEIQPKN
jgi:hypothetical protein